jgi:hypothetical protein
MPYEDVPGVEQENLNTRILRKLEATAARGGTQVLREDVPLELVIGNSQIALRRSSEKVARAVSKGLGGEGGEVSKDEAAMVIYDRDVLMVRAPGRASDGTEISESSIVLGRIPSEGSPGRKRVIGVGHRLVEKPRDAKNIALDPLRQDPYEDRVDSGVSAEHVEVVVKKLPTGERAVYVEDLGSTNGTWKSYKDKRQAPGVGHLVPTKMTQMEKGKPLRMREGDKLFLAGEVNEARTVVEFDGFTKPKGGLPGMAKLKVASRA